MPTRSISSRFIQTSIHDSGIPHVPHRELSNTQRRVLFLPPKRSPFKAGSLLFGSFFLFGFAFVSGPMPYRSPDRSKGSLKQHVCTVPTKRNVRALMGGKNLGASGGKKKKPLPLFLSHARKVWSAGAGTCQALAVRRGCDVSHFRMDRTMCDMPPSFFLFFLSC